MNEMEVTIAAPNGRSWSQPRGLFINNEFIPSSDGRTLASINPTTEEKICDVYTASSDDVDTAVRAARAALKHPTWKQLSGTDRGRLLSRLADLVETHAEELATSVTLDNGKPYRAAYDDDAMSMAKTLRYYAGYADKFYGSVVDVGPAKLAYTVKEPVGVCALIIPWNYPLDTAACKLGPALCCGNTVVLKLAEQTPLSMLVVARLVREAGFPPGVVNVLNGHGRETGAALVDHAGVDAVSFTGSTAAGKTVMARAATTMKRVTLETGGKSPLLVFDDADLAPAVRWAHAGIMSNQGQICTATSRLLVQRGIYDAFVKAFVDAVERLSVVGDPFDETTFQGPQVTRTQYDRVLSYIQTGINQGATLVTGGGPWSSSLDPSSTSCHRSRGFFVKPTVFANVRPDMHIYHDEIFGPCAVIAPFDTEDEAVAAANDTTYGLGAAVFTRDMKRAHRVARAIEAGMVWINSSNDSDYRVPFGGVKQSGIGRELGEAGLDAYYSVKSIHVNMGEDN